VIAIDELVEMWTRKGAAHDDDLSWWREAMANLRPTLDDDAIAEDGEEKRI
jgi:hypothetical protein